MPVKGEDWTGCCGEKEGNITGYKPITLWGGSVSCEIKQQNMGRAIAAC